jgi:chromosome partitioning protein
MKIVAIVAQKGGTGKSTLARHGGVILPRCGLLDLDPQRTSLKWMEKRQAAGQIGPAMVNAAWYQVGKVVAAIGNRLDWLLIDTLPSYEDNRTIRAAVDVADLVLIPVKPSQDDLDTLPQTLAVINGRRFAFVITMATKSKLLDRARASLVALGTVAPIIIGNRVAYPEATEVGAAVTETNPSGPAAIEMRRLWDWVATTA